VVDEKEEQVAMAEGRASAAAAVASSSDNYCLPTHRLVALSTLFVSRSFNF
jgi:hypothetical protein